MDKIFYLGYKVVKNESDPNRHKKEFDKDYIGNHYCCECKNQFIVEDYKNPYLHKYYKGLNDLDIPKPVPIVQPVINTMNIGIPITMPKSKQIEDKEVVCPHCNNKALLSEIKEFQIRYQLTFSKFINNDIVVLSNKTIEFLFGRERVISRTVEERHAINMKTGQSYYQSYINRRRKQFTNITYSYTGTKDIIGRTYTKECKDNIVNEIDLEEDMYNTIRDYKIKNGIFKYIPTYDELIAKGDIEDRETNKCINKGLDLDLLIKLNRFPGVTYKDIKSLCPDYFSLRLKTRHSDKFIEKHRKVVKSVKQDKSDRLIDVTLESFKMSNNKTNRNNLKKYGLQYIVGYNLLVLEEVVSLDNYYKLLSVLDTIYVDRLYNFFNLEGLKGLKNKAQNNICNKIVRELSSTKEFRRNNPQLDTLRRDIVPRYRNIDENYINDIMRNAIDIQRKVADYKFDWSINIRKMHDYLSSEVTKIYNEKLVFEYELFKDKDKHFDYSEGGLHFSLAKDSHELIDIGKYMNICVGSYGRYVMGKNCHIVVVRDNDNTPVICIEINRELDKLIQVKKRFNLLVEDLDEIKIVENWCKKYDLDYCNDRAMICFHDLEANRPDYRHIIIRRN